MTAKKKKDGGQRNPIMPRPSYMWIYVLVAAFIIGYSLYGAENTEPVRSDWNTVEGMVRSGDVERIEVVNRDVAEVFLKKDAVEKYRTDSTQPQFKRLPDEGVQLVFNIGSVDAFREDLKAAEQQSGQSVPVRYENKENGWMNLLVNFLPWVLIIGVWFFIMRGMSRGGGAAGGGLMNVGKAKAQVYDKDAPKRVTFKDVAGLEEAKVEVMEIVDFLRKPEKYRDLGAKIPKGALLVGPPGTGKTLLAKAVAGEANVPFLSISGSDFVEMFVGVGASRVRELFDEAKKNAPCIIFIDEIDAIGKSRDSRYGGGNDEREQTLNQLLAEMDGFDTSSGLLILAATNRPEVLDSALLRPGRFDRRVIVDRPDLKGRVDILKVHAKNVHLDETVDFEAIALATSGAVGSDLANMINEAAILAVKKGRNKVSQKDLFEAVEVVLVGKEKKNKILSAKEREIVSYHEVGHALVSALQKHSEPVQKITIVPRTMGALGYVMNVPEEEKYLSSEAELRARLVECVGGRAAEEIVFDSVTTGASNDIEQATKIARAMVTQYGMSKKFGLMGLEVAANQYLDDRTVMNCSDATAAEVDEEVRKVLQESYDEAKRLLTEHRKTLDQIAEFLIQKETISGKEFMEIFKRVEEENQPKPEIEAAEDSKTEAEPAEQAAVSEADASEVVPKSEASETEQAPETTENKEDM